MSDSPVAADLARKRSRSVSPSAGNSPSASKKQNNDAAPTALEIADDSAIPSQAEDNSASANEPAATATTVDSSDADKQPTGEEATPMAVDSTAEPSQAAAPTDSSIPPAPQAPAVDPATTIQMRALIVTQDASIIIGKQGKNVNEIRDKSGSKITITESVPGNPERVMVVGGQLDAVSKAFGLIVRRINDEPFDVPSVPGSRAVTIR